MGSLGQPLTFIPIFTLRGNSTLNFFLLLSEKLSLHCGEKKGKIKLMKMEKSEQPICNGD